MKKKNMDVRGLVSMEPPEGLAAWAYSGSTKLRRSGLLYEAVWTSEMGMEELLSPDPKPKRVKMVRVTCSACGQSALMQWTRDRAHGYGFVCNYEYAESGEAFADGDETECPLCGEKVLVRKKAALGRFGSCVTGESTVMSASLIGEQRMLALTGWVVRNRVYRAGHERLEILPAEAYVFDQDSCVQLLNWRNSYSGNAGYSVSYGVQWRQPKRWTERWGGGDRIFGLTPELVAQSCLPHCKLDVYMDGFPGSHRKYPVSYLRLYQEHPNAEALMLHGLPLVLHELIREEYPKQSLAEIRWQETKPSAMLGLTREELRLGQEQQWGAFLWRLFTRAKAAGERLSGEDMKAAWMLGDENALDLIGRGPVGKSIQYLLDQIWAAGAEVDEEDADDVMDVGYLLDYWRMAERAGRNLNDPQVRFPRDLVLAHDAMIPLCKEVENAQLRFQFRIRRKQLEKYSFRADGLLIRAAKSQEELTKEGNALHHCVGTYGSKHANGQSAIFFIRRTSEPGVSYYTLEFDVNEMKVLQNRGMRNCSRTDDIQAFENKWLAWVQAGCRKDAKGRPVLQEKKKPQAA